MGNYEKPVITIDAGMAEGIYASSGAQQITVSAPTVIANWGGSGQVEFTLDLSSCNLTNLIVILTFNMDITNAWGAGSNSSVSGKTATLSWISSTPQQPAKITVQANGNVTELQCTGSSYSNK